MYKKAICLVSSKDYFFQTKHAILSAKKHNPDYDIVLLSDGIETDIAEHNISLDVVNLNQEQINLTTGKPVWLVTGRPAIVKYALSELNYDYCIFIDGDTYTYNSFSKIEQLINNNYSLVVTPHNLIPLPNDNRFPSINDICLMGNYNSGFFVASKKSMDFINWWEMQTRKFPIMDKQNGIAAEQGWLRFAADFCEGTKILRDPSYNVAYWNVAQRDFNIKNNEYYVGDTRLTIMHFSGFQERTPPELMSRYQNRYKLEKTSPIYKIFQEYKNIIWN